MCYILIKRFDKHDGCVAFETEQGPKLAELKTKLEDITLIDKDIEVVIISRPSMYGEYAPYNYVRSKSELIKEAKRLVTVA